MKIGGKIVNFLVNTGATHSVLLDPGGLIFERKTAVQGATGKIQEYPWTTERTVDLGRGTVTHSFLVIPECPAPLLDRDLLQKLKATVTFGDSTPQMSISAPSTILITCPLSEEYLLYEKEENVGPSMGPLLDRQAPDRISRGMGRTQCPRVG